MDVRLAVHKRRVQLVGPGPFSDFVEEALEERFNPQNIYSRYQLQRFGCFDPSGGVPDVVPSTTFSQFLATVTGKRPDESILRLQLSNIHWALAQPRSQPPSQFHRALEDTFYNPYAVFNAAIQPGLARVAPAIRGSFLQGAQRGFLNALANDPGQFATPLSSFEWFAPRWFVEESREVLLERFRQGRCGPETVEERIQRIIDENAPSQ